MLCLDTLAPEQSVRYFTSFFTRSWGKGTNVRPRERKREYNKALGMSAQFRFWIFVLSFYKQQVLCIRTV